MSLSYWCTLDAHNGSIHQEGACPVPDESGRCFFPFPFRPPTSLPFFMIKPFHFSLLSFFPSLLCFLPPLSVVPLLIWAFSLFPNIEEIDVFGSRCNYCHLLRAETLYLCGFPVLQVSARSRGGAFSPRSWRGARCESSLCVIARAGRGQCGRRWVAEATPVMIVWGTPAFMGCLARAAWGHQSLESGALTTSLVFISAKLQALAWWAPGQEFDSWYH